MILQDVEGSAFIDLFSMPVNTRPLSPVFSDPDANTVILKMPPKT